MKKIEDTENLLRKPDVVRSAVFNEDCMLAMKQYPDKFFHLAICDPPYGINVAKLAYTQEDNRPCKQKNGTTLRVKKLKYEHKDWDKEPPPQEYFDELRRVSQHQIIWGINYFKWEGVGKGRLKWNKCVPEGVSFSNYEYAYCSLIEDEREIVYLWAGMCQGKSLAEPTTQQGNKKLNEKRIHPTHKPIRLYDWLYREFGQKGWRILDTHLGGGSNRIACHRAGLDFTAYEIDKGYFEAQEARWKNFIAQTVIQWE